MTIVISPDNPHVGEYMSVRKTRKGVNDQIRDLLRQMNELNGIALAWERFGILHGVKRKDDKDTYRLYTAVKTRINETLDRIGYVVLSLQSSYAGLTRKMEELAREKGD